MSRLIISIIVSLLLSGLSLGCDESPDKLDKTSTPPQYTLKVVDASGNTYSDLLTLVGPGIKVQDKTVRILAQTAQGESPIYAIRNDALLQPAVNGSYELIPGNNQLGVFVGAYPKGPQTIGINWINVYYKSTQLAVVTLRPAVLEGERDVFYKFTAETENPPMMASYEWIVNGEPLGKGGGNELTTRFPVAGTYRVSATIYDVFFKETVGTGEAVAIIK